MSLRALSVALVAAGVFAPAGSAFALWGDRLELFASERIVHDSNLFRLSPGVNPAGTSERSDTYYVTSYGLNLDVPVSRQRFQAGYARNDARFSRFTDLNFNGHDARALWLWQLGNDLNGQLGYTETKALASFNNIQARLANPLKTQQTFANANYQLTPRWRLRGGVAELQQRNGNALLQANDIDVRSSDFSVSYVTPAQNSIGLGVRSEDGRFPNRQIVAGGTVDNAYHQNGVGVLGEWNVTAASRLSGRVDRIKREFDQVPQRDFQGTTYRAAYDWKPAGRFSFTGVAQRDISAVEDIRTTFVLVKGISLTPSYILTEKMRLSGTVDVSTREYLGDPGFVLGGATAGRRDRLRVAALTLSYQPARNITLLGAIQREQRTSNVVGADYTANVISLSARAGF